MPVRVSRYLYETLCNGYKLNNSENNDLMSKHQRDHRKSLRSSGWGINDDNEEKTYDLSQLHVSTKNASLISIRETLPGTMTISFLRVLSLRSLTSSDLSMPSVKAFAPATKAKTILATFSAVFPLASTSPFPGYSLSPLIASAASPGLF